MKVILAAAVAIILAASTAQAGDKLICANYDERRETCLEYYVTGDEPAAPAPAEFSEPQTPANRIFIFPSRPDTAADH